MTAAAEATARWRERNPEKYRESQARHREARRARRAAELAAQEAAHQAAQREALVGSLGPVLAVLEARERSLALPAATRTAAGTIARHRRAEVLDLIAYLKAHAAP